MRHPRALYGLIGHPVATLRSPTLFNGRLQDWVLPGSMVAFDIVPEELEVGLAGLRVMRNLVGFLVTMPHKERLVSLLDGVTPEAKAAGAANIVRRGADGRLFGGQLDGAGFVAAMRLSGFDPQGKRLYVAGAGGVSAGICAALAAAGAARIDIFNRNAERAGLLARRLGASYPRTAIATVDGGPTVEADAVVNATSLGMRPDDALPFSLDPCRDGTFVGDVVNTAEPTPLLRAAAARGFKGQSGQAMVEPQLALMREFFAGN